MPELYIEKPSGYKVTIQDHQIEPMIYQPTYEGMVLLSEKYNEKYEIDIRIVNEVDFGDHEPTALKRIRRFKNNADIDTIIESEKTVGIILMHGENHAIPILFSREEDKKYMIIFDSSSGARIPGHYPIGNDFPDFQVMINLGTRQADGTSCITDAICILKDALRMEGLGSYLMQTKAVEDDAKKDETREAPRLFFATSKPDNFTVFRMPEELLKTAQREDFIEKSEADRKKMITKSNDTLDQKRYKDRATVAFNGKPFEPTGINRYLHEKSKRHAEYLDKILRGQGNDNPGIAAGARI